VTTRTKVWTREFPDETPRQHVDMAHGRLINLWPLSSTAAKTVLASDPRLKAAVSGARLKESDALLEIQDLAKGTVIGRVGVATGSDSSNITTVTSDGDELAITDRQNQVIAYALSTGGRLGSLFGRFAFLSVKAGLLCVQNESGRVACHDPQSLERVSEFTLARPVRMARFSPDGSRLLLITADQVAHVLDAAVLRTPASMSR
jgi:hypothetical protein